MSAEGKGRRPDLLLVVLDCVRASDFPGGRDPIGPMPFVDRLRKESIYFPRAASVAHWTVPAHATMFTGLYPWEHGVHAKGRLLLDASVPRVADFLRDAGYRTLSLSANGLVSPGLGLTGGFDRAAWGVSLFNRVSDRTEPPLSLDGDSERAVRLESTLRSQYRQISYWAAVVLARYPFIWDGGTHLTAKLRHPGNGYRPQMSNWLEPTLANWLAAEPKDTPTYTFINLLDAHEQYLYDREVRSSLSAWWEFARTRQDRLGWVVGEWKPSPEEFRLLHDLYRGMIRAMDRRLERIVQAYQKAGRWDNTMMILTSDHGQAFGEHGALFHILGVDEPEIRVPLYLRPPGGLAAPKSAKGWASLLDIPSSLGPARPSVHFPPPP
ncbi:MAG: sulfatase-like hydrolase/transferase [Thermoplasmata archaeon]|nr:sulfatase-like hydrolase/transferase [Thermoplasmata archaeon]